jgi:hypothetical protein
MDVCQHTLPQPHTCTCEGAVVCCGGAVVAQLGIPNGHQHSSNNNKQISNTHQELGWPDVSVIDRVKLIELAAKLRMDKCIGSEED